MKRFILPLAALSALAVAAPAFAQPDEFIGARERNIEWRIDQGLRTGDLSPYQADRLRGRIHYIYDIQYRYSRDGINPWERADLVNRLDNLSADLAAQTRDYRRSEHMDMRWRDHDRRWWGRDWR